MPMRRVLFLLAIVISLSSAQGQEKNLPYVILVSFDGFSHEYIKTLDLPNFSAFIKNGAAADALIPSFPSKTFPNHYTIVTGLYPGNHGLVDNHFYDPTLQRQYSMRDKEAVTDSIFYGGLPLWQLAKQQGLKTASYFWVGSEVNDPGMRPDFSYRYDQSVPFPDRVEKVVEWLKLPEHDRPHFITLYFSSPDTESHRYGPFAQETQKKVIAMDALLGDLMKGLDSLRLPINVILVSDHGMSALTEKTENYIFLDELVKSVQGKLTVVNGGTQAHIYTTGKQQRDSLYTALSAKANGFSVVKREDFPERWHYNHLRSGDLLIVAHSGKYILSVDREKLRQTIKEGAPFGAHGYDPEQGKDMHGIFYAKGPNIKPGARIPAFQNIHIYPLIARILELKIPVIDGEFRVLEPVYRK